MSDLHFGTPAAEEISVDQATAEAIRRGIADADAGRTVSLDEACSLVSQWISEFESQKKP